MLLRICFLVLAVTSFSSCTSNKAIAQTLIGDTVAASNTFESASFTGGIETIFQVGSATVADPGVELTQFAGIYDMDFSGDALTMSLVNNEGLAIFEYGAGDFDRYYIGFDGHFVDSVELAGGDAELTSGVRVGLLSEGFELEVSDLLDSGIGLPREYPTGGFFIELGEGTDLRTLGKAISFNFTTSAVPEPSSSSLLGGAWLLVLLILRHRWR